MARRQHQLVRFPSSCNDNADVGLYIDSKAAVLIGINQQNPGVGTRIFWKKRVQLDADFDPQGRICGVFQYTGQTEPDDKIILFKDGGWYWCDVSANAPTSTINALNFTSSQLTAINDDSGITFDPDKRVRAVQIGSELCFVQEGGVLPVRYNGTDILKLGMDTPSSPTDGGNLAGGPLVVGATYLYAITRVDEFGRESSPSDNLVVTMGAGGGRTINWTAPSDPQEVGTYLYRSTALPPGSTAGTLYRVVESPAFASGQTTWDDNAISDTLIVFNTPAPLPGQNDPPLAASLISIYKNRLALNAVAQPRVIQISNLEEPGSYSQLGPLYSSNGQLLNATDGITFAALNEYGDEVTALDGVGSVLAVWNRRTTGVFEGDNPAEYQFRIVPRSVGCTAPDSVQNCGNVSIFLSEDGVYAFGYDSGFAVKKVSEDYDNFFRSASVLFDPPGEWPPTQSFGRQERASAATSCFLQNRYVLASPPYTYVLDLDNNGQSLDTMTGMPYGSGDLGNSNGLMCMSRIFADRQYEVALYSPGIGFSTPVGDLYVMSFYGLTNDSVGTPEPWAWTYVTRGIDGAGVPRTRLKRFKTVRIYGKIEPMVEADGTVTGEALLQGNISFIVDQTRVFPSSGTWYFDNITQSGTNFVGAYYDMFKKRGLIWEQELPLDCVGYIGQVQINGTLTNGWLSISDVMVDYDPLDGAA